MTSKTIALSGAEIEVSGLNGANAHIRNDGTAAVYAAKTSGIVAGADDVASIPAGQSVSIRGISGRVYLLGTGSVYIQSDDYTACPFKTSAQAGGSGADEVARAAIEAHAGNADIHISAVEKAAWNGKAELSDIPDKLPADGGNADTLNGRHSGRIATKDQNGEYFDDNAENINDAYLQWDGSHFILKTIGGNLTMADNADTVDGKHADDFISVTTGVNFSTSAKDYAETYKSGAENIEFTWRGYGATDAPDSDGDWFFHAYRGDSNWIRIVAFDIRHTASYEIAKAGGSWGEWKKLADGGNAASVGAYTEAKIAALEARIAALEGGGT